MTVRDAATDDSRAFTEAIVESKPAIFLWTRHRIVLSFEDHEQASETFQLLGKAISSARPASTVKEEP